MLDWRRNKVQQLLVRGYSQWDIADELQIDQSTVSRDIQCLRQQAHENLQKHVQEKLPEEYQRCLTGLNQVLKLSWDIANKSKDGNGNDNGQTMTMTDDKTRLQALSLINDCYKYIMDLTTNGVVITDAIKFVQTNKERLTDMSKEDNDSKDKDRLEEETGELPNNTTNNTF
jgi:IS30 family transposase